MQHVALFHNPTAGYGPHTPEKLTKALRDAGYRVTYFDLKKSLNDPAAWITGDFIVVAGGDGSLRKVALKLVGTGRAMAPIPVGTANNIARSLGLHGEPEQIIAGWTKTSRRRIDIGVAEGPWGRQRFIEGFGLGLLPRSSRIIGDIDHASSRDFNTAEERLHRNRCVIAALAYEAQPLAMELVGDGETLTGEFLLAQAMNIDRVGPGLVFAPHSRLDDGLLDLITLRPAQRQVLQEKMKDFLAGTTTTADLARQRCRSIQLTVGATEFLIDDQLLPLHSPATIKLSVEPAALELVVPASTLPATGNGRA